MTTNKETVSIGKIALRPITIICGDNGAGKSWLAGKLGAAPSSAGSMLSQMIRDDKSIQHAVAKLCLLSAGRKLLWLNKPEESLHPRRHAIVCDVIVGVMRAHAVTQIVETHSGFLISRLGELIESGELSRDNVLVVLVSRIINEPAQIRTTTFDKDGMLAAWPPGFLSA